MERRGAGYLDGDLAPGVATAGPPDGRAGAAPEHIGKQAMSGASQRVRRAVRASLVADAAGEPVREVPGDVRLLRNRPRQADACVVGHPVGRRDGDVELGSSPRTLAHANRMHHCSMSAVNWKVRSPFALTDSFIDNLMR